MYICIYINIYIYRRANGIYIQKKLQHMDSLSLLVSNFIQEKNMQTFKLMGNLKTRTNCPYAATFLDIYSISPPMYIYIYINTYIHIYKYIYIYIWCVGSLPTGALATVGKVPVGF